MELTQIINIVLIAVLAICVWIGFKKGIIMGIIQVLVIILSLYGAQLLSDTFSYEVIPVLRPFVSGFMEGQVRETTYEVFGYQANEEGEYPDVTVSLTDLMASAPENADEIALRSFQSLGLYDDLAKALADRALSYANDGTTSLMTAVVTVLCQAVTWYLGFLLAFFILFSILTVIVNLPNLSFRIPYVGIINDLGGAAIGLGVGIIFCALIVWLFQFAGLLLPEETMRSTGVAAYFLEKNYLGGYITF